MVNELAFFIPNIKKPRIAVLGSSTGRVRQPSNQLVS